MTVTRLVLATRNTGKLAELRQMLAAVPALVGVEVVGVADLPGTQDVAETGVTFEENARLKARTICDEVGLPCIADDSGLAVDVLGGCPGVFSARWAGEHGDDEANIDLLLAQTAEVDQARLTAHFVSCVVLALPGGGEQVYHGRVDGVLVRERRGDNGFGYDPVFGLPDGRTMAQLTADEKNAISHRGQAMRSLVPQLPAALRL